jgi:hypothetical protein
VIIQLGSVYAGMATMAPIVRKSRNCVRITVRRLTGCVLAKKAVVALSPLKDQIALIMSVIRRNYRCVIIMASVRKIVHFQWDFVNAI